MMVFIIGAAAVAATVLIWLEWRRPNQRLRFFRMLGSVIAVGALALLAFSRPEPEAGTKTEMTEAILWTATESQPLPRFALVDANENAVVVPDVPYVLREHPEIRRLTIRGGGLEPYDLEALRDVQVQFEPAVEEARSPTIRYVHLPREIALGERLVLQGRVEGVRTSEPVTLALVAPDGSTTETSVSAEAGTFEISAPSPPAEGAFVWRLKMTAGGAVLLEETMGVAVVARVMPRVLVLESSPRFETAHLQRWLAKIGGAFRARTKVARDRYRFAASAGEAQEFDGIDTALLANIDVAVIDLRALIELAEDERQVLLASVKEGGVGLLVLSSGEAEWPTALDAFLPWKIAAAEEGERTARLQWDGAGAVEKAVRVEEFSVTEAGEVLVRDSQRRPLVSAIRNGRGFVALSLVRETWQWRLEDQEEIFARYWSFLFSKLAAGRNREVQKWQIANAANAPLAINQPVELRYSGAAERPRPAEVFAGAEREAVVLPLAQDMDEPAQWSGTFWPRRAGWHRVVAPKGGAQLHFYIHEAGEWASLRSARRRMATEKFATLSKEKAANEREAAAEPPTAPKWALSVLGFALFLLSSGFLWIERRTAAGSLHR